MAHASHERAALLAMFLIATLAIAGLVALVAQGPVAARSAPAARAADTDVRGLASGTAVGVVRYVGYDAIHHALSFTDALGVPLQAPVDGSGAGALVYGGHAYALQLLARSASDRPAIAMDTDRDGKVDRKAQPGDKILLS